MCASERRETGGDTFYGNNTGSAGADYGDSTLATWFYGSGGGGGAPDTESDGNSSYNVTGDGGSGGGLIAIYSGSSITVCGWRACGMSSAGRNRRFTGSATQPNSPSSSLVGGVETSSAHGSLASAQRRASSALC